MKHLTECVVLPFDSHSHSCSLSIPYLFCIHSTPIPYLFCSRSVSGPSVSILRTCSEEQTNMYWKLHCFQIFGKHSDNVTNTSMHFEEHILVVCILENIFFLLFFYPLPFRICSIAVQYPFCPFCTHSVCSLVAVRLLHSLLGFFFTVLYNRIKIAFW